MLAGIQRAFPNFGAFAQLAAFMLAGIQRAFPNLGHFTSADDYIVRSLPERFTSHTGLPDSQAGDAVGISCLDLS